MTTLTQALSIEPGDCVAVAGAGGKTTLCWRLVQEIAMRGERAIFTTTTKIWQPTAGVFDMLHVRPHPSPLLLSASRGMGEGADWRTACFASAVEGSTDLTAINGAGMPSVQTKLTGFTAEDICALHESINTQQSITFCVEADGARGSRIKAPGTTEPVIPPCADVVCVLVSLDAIGRPLDERIAHRVDRISQLTGAMPGAMITPSLVVDLLSHHEGGMKGIPDDARKIAVLTQQGGVPHPDATHMMAELTRRGFERAVTIAPRAPQPVLLSSKL